MVDEPISFSERRKKLLEERALARGEVPASETPTWDSGTDLGPDTRSDDDREMDDRISQIDIIDAYIKWCGKMRPDPKGKRESIMISCPIPAHPDKNPSAWINLDKQTWYCAGCDQGGDIHDLAAFSHGYPVPGYKNGEMFHKLRTQMAEDFGWRFKKVPGGKVAYQVAPEPETPPMPEQPSDSSTDAPLDTAAKLETESHPASPGVSSLAAEKNDSDTTDGTDNPDTYNVSQMFAPDDEEADLVAYPTIAWRGLIPEDTFLFEYMNACCNDDSPEEYHFWHGLLALGSVVGRHVTLDDHRPVYGNLLVCLLGATGTGKSRSRGWLDDVLRAASPYHEDGTSTTGTKIVPVPGSGEYLVRAFSYEGKDPTNNKSSLGYQPVNGIVDFDELAALLARANRQGSTLKSTIMGMADARNEVKIGSLTSGDSIAVEPFCSITASTQPKAIRALLNRTDTGSGFLNRWVFAGGESKQIEVLGGARSSTVIDLDEAVVQLKKVRGWGAMDRKISMDDDAYVEYVNFFRSTIEPMKLKDDTDLLKRIDLLSKKIMLLLTINLRKQAVPLQVVLAMEDIIKYCVECFGILNENIGVTVMQDVMTEIMRHISRHQERTKRGASARDILKYTKRKNYSLEQIKKALDVMTALDMVELVKPKSQVGRPTIRYEVVGE